MATRPPVVFTSPDGEPDVRFKIFGTYELHAHSWVLKEHSSFFRSYLDPSWRLDPTSAIKASLEVGRAPRFRYEWVSKVEERDKGCRCSWCVRSATSLLVNENEDQGSIALCCARHQLEQWIVFRDFIGSFYQQSFMIPNHKWLNHLARMADSYIAHRVVSLNLDRSFDNNLVTIQPDKAILFLPSAITLRNTRLFKDCMVMASGKWPMRLLYEDDKAKEILSELPPKVVEHLENIQDEIAAYVAEVLWELDNMVIPRPNDDHGLASIKADMRKVIEDLKLRSMAEVGPPYVFAMPKYLRALSRSELTKDYGDYRAREPNLGDSLDLLLENGLALYPAAVSGEGCFEYHFLGVGISDEDLPWDNTNDKNWE